MELLCIYFGACSNSDKIAKILRPVLLLGGSYVQSRERIDIVFIVFFGFTFDTVDKAAFATEVSSANKDST